MIRSLFDLTRHEFRARDGDLGRVDDFYFDDASWTVRYLVLETGRWLPGRRKLIHPESVAGIDWSRRQVVLDLDREDIEKSPEPSADPPVSRQQLAALHEHYGLGPGWLAAPYPLDASGALASAATDVPPPAEEHAREDRLDPNLRSTKELLGYELRGRDHESAGVIDDVACDDKSWQIRYVVADTRKWLPGRKFLVAVAWIDAIDTVERHADVDLTREQLREAPTFDPRAPINRRYEERLFDFYGRPKYWAQEREAEG